MTWYRHELKVFIEFLLRKNYLNSLLYLNLTELKRRKTLVWKIINCIYWIIWTRAGFTLMIRPEQSNVDAPVSNKKFRLIFKSYNNVRVKYKLFIILERCGFYFSFTKAPGQPPHLFPFKSDYDLNHLQRNFMATRAEIAQSV
jgi:hypothetical protein